MCHFEDSSGKQGADKVIRQVKAPRCVHDLQLVPRLPLPGNLHLTVYEAVPNLRERKVGRHGNINQYQGHKARSHHQQDLQGIDIQESFDAARHRIKGGNHAQDEDGIHQELEVDGPIEDNGHGDGGDEQARTRGEELAQQEHAAGPSFGALAETLANESVDGDGARVIEPRQEEPRHQQAAENGAHAEHQVGEVGVEAQFRRTHEGAGAHRCSRRRQGHQPAGHGFAGQEVVPDVPVAP